MAVVDGVRAAETKITPVLGDLPLAADADRVAMLGIALLGGVAKDREDRHARPKVDGVITPFSRGDAQAVQIEKPGKFASIERDNAAPRLLVGEPVQIGHAAATRFIFSAELLQMHRRR